MRWVRHPLDLLSNRIAWRVFEEAFSPLCCEGNGCPCKSIRRMAGLLIRKRDMMLSAAAFNFKRAMRHLFALLRQGLFQPLCDVLFMLLTVNRIPAVTGERAKGAF